MESFKDKLIIIPAYNEEGTISEVVSSLVTICDVLVINDASTDKTMEKARLAGAKVITHEFNKGYSEAISTGFKNALESGYKYVLTFDADGQHEPSLVNTFFSNLVDDKADVVFGERECVARFSEFLMNLYFKLRFGINDSLCGMKAYDVMLFKEFNGFETFNSIGTELLFNSLRAGKRCLPIPMKILDRKDKPRFGNRIIANLIILKAMLYLIRKDIVN